MGLQVQGQRVKLRVTQYHAPGLTDGKGLGLATERSGSDRWYPANLAWDPLVGVDKPDWVGSLAP